MLPDESKSNLDIGPLSFSYQVQDISLQEDKNIDVVQGTRSSKNFIIDSGRSSQKVIVRLLFSGVDEINDRLRKLIALFRCCPILSIRNEMISASWGALVTTDTTLDPIKLLGKYSAVRDKITIGKRPNSYSFVPAAFEDITISPVPDVPNALLATITLSRIDVSSVYADPNYPNGLLLYQGQTFPEKSPDPEDAYYLKKWLDILTRDQKIPLISEDDFSNIEISWIGEYATGESIESIDPMLSKLSFDNNPHTKIYSESVSVRNIFAYNTMQGKGSPFPQHMGSTSRFYSMDILFTNQENNEDFNRFCRFKESADKIAREKERFARVAGWVISSPIVKLLANPDSDKTILEYRPRSGAFVPMNVAIQNGDQPLTKTVRLDLAETNLDFFKETESLLLRGGSDYRELKRFYNSIATQEINFRKTIKNNPEALINAITGTASPGNNGSELFDAFSTYWPVVNGDIRFSTSEIFGILNRDTFRAALLSPKFDQQDRLVLALKALPVLTGQVRTGTTVPSFVERVKQNSSIIHVTFFGPDKTQDPYSLVYDIIKDYVQNKMFTNSTDNDPIFISLGSLGPKSKLIAEVTNQVFFSFIGDYTSFLDFTSEIGTTIQLLSQSDLEFSSHFKDAIFDVVVSRNLPPEGLQRVFSIDGLYTAFAKLIIKYTGENSNKEISDPQKTSAVNKYFSRSVYEDLLLPKYRELYEDEWEAFAPKYGDLGIINDSEAGAVVNDSRAAQEAVAVNENDTVPPSAWFHNRKWKNRLLDEIKDNSSAISTIGHKYQLSLPFNIDDITEIEKEYKETENNPRKSKDGLHKLIRSAFRRAKNSDPEAYTQTMQELSLLSQDKYKEQYIDKEGNFYLYVHNNNNYVARKKLSVPGVASELYTVAKDYKLLRPADQLQVDIDSGMKSSDRSLEFEFIRSLDANTASCIKSDIDQMTDVYESAIKMFPAVKVYLLEKRGTDLYGDDSFFSVNSILSIDITTDKDDADLAVIRIADPLFMLQKDFFPANNVIEVDGKGVNAKRVLGSLQGSAGGYLKRYKIAEGRRIEIRMGYDSMPKNLKTVFTGKIVEIEPGDVLTIVCQGWKSELIGRQVNFYNDNVKNWGARDLAIMAIQAANPDGYGDFYPQMSTDYILKNIKARDVQELASVILRRQATVSTVEGSIGFAESIADSVGQFLGLEARTKSNQGLDTRLKNVWWPDLPSINGNLLGWRTTFGIMPSQINDSWVVPLQPAWDVLKEASRHAWNSIVAVVPYDGEATIFFGHPDQPYYFTKGSNISQSQWQKFQGLQKTYTDSNTKIVEGFKNSSEYNIIEDQLRLDLYIRDIVADGKLLKLAEIDNSTVTSVRTAVKKLITDTDLLINPSGIISKLKLILPPRSEINSDTYRPNYKLISSMLPPNSSLVYGEAFAEIINSSYLPTTAFESLKDKLAGNLAPILLNLYLGLPLNSLYTQWPSADSDLARLMLPDQNETTIRGALSSLNLSREEETTINKARYYANNLRNSIGPLSDTYTISAEFAGLNGPKPSEQLYRAINSQLVVGEEADYYNKVLQRFRDIETIVSLGGYERLGGSFFSSSGGTKTLKYKQENAESREKFTQQRDFLIKLTNEILELTRVGPPKTETVSGTTDPATLIDNIADFKAFVFFFDQYLSNTVDSEISAAVEQSSKQQTPIFPPNMKVFRQHHWVQSDKDIIKNNIVASTKDMWNSVVVEHPAHHEATSKVTEDELFRGSSEFFSGIKWVYYPKNEISGVVGLQFHPGLTLAQKKLRIFTELNCQSNELAAKLACTHLADGIRRMYRGTLSTTGRIIKPHDRIILDDSYNNMTGPLEVESVIHHWSIDTGWITNIQPQAVCDANPGAAILQTAALEDTFNKVFKVIDYVSDAINIAIIVGTLGAATPLAVGSYTVKKGVQGVLRNLFVKGPSRYIYSTLRRNLATRPTAILKSLAGSGGSPRKILGELWSKAGGPALSGFKNWLYTNVARQATHTAYRLATTSSFVTNAQKTQQLPIILNPLYFNGIPFLAGMETDDPVFSVHFAGTFWSLRDLNQGAERVLEQLFGNTYTELDEVTRK